MRRRHVILLLGLASAGAVAAFGDRTLTSTLSAAATEKKVPEPILRESGKVSGRSRITAEAPVDSIQTLVRRDHGSPKEEPNGSEGLFASRSWVPPPPAAPPQEKPTAPPLSFVYLGKVQEQGNWKVFLGREDSTWVLKTGDQLGDAYRVESITPPTMTLRYLPLNEPQTLSIE